MPSTSAGMRSRGPPAPHTATTPFAAAICNSASATSAPTAAGSGSRDRCIARVRFQQGNLFDAGFLPGARVYDVIFCRNVLIYFDSATQERAVGLLSSLLSDGGTLFVGPSEGNLLLDQGYVSVRAAPFICVPQGDGRPAGQDRRSSPAGTSPGRGAGRIEADPLVKAEAAVTRPRRRRRGQGSTRSAASPTGATSRKQRASARATCAITARRRKGSTSSV